MTERPQCNRHRFYPVAMMQQSRSDGTTRAARRLAHFVSKSWISEGRRPSSDSVAQIRQRRNARGALKGFTSEFRQPIAPPPTSVHPKGLLKGLGWSCSRIKAWNLPRRIGVRRVRRRWARGSRAKPRHRVSSRRQSQQRTMGRMLHENKVPATPRHHSCLSPTGVNGH